MHAILVSLVSRGGARGTARASVGRLTSFAGEARARSDPALEGLPADSVLVGGEAQKDGDCSAGEGPDGGPDEGRGDGAKEGDGD